MQNIKKVLLRYKIEFSTLVFFLLLRIPTFFEKNWYVDEGIYLAIGKNLLHGDILYSDIWDHKPPFIYFLNSFFALFNDPQISILVSRIFGFILTLGSMVLLYSIVKRFIGFKTDRIKLVFCLFLSIIFGSFLIEFNVTNAEILFLPINLIFIYVIFFLFSKRDAVNLSLIKLSVFSILAGFLLFISFTIKISGFIETTLLFGIVLVYFLIEKKYKDLFKIIIISSSFFGLLLAGLLFYFYQNNALADFYFGVFGANFSYVDDNNNSLVLYGLKINFNLLRLITIIALSIVITLAVKKKKLAKTDAIILILFFIEFFCTFLSGKPYPHYLQQLVPSVFLLIILGLNKSHSISRIKQISTAIVCLILISISVSNFAGNRSNEAKEFLDYYPGFVNNYILGKTSGPTFSKWDNNRLYKRASNFSKFIEKNYPTDKKYFLYSNEPWLELTFPYETTNTLIISFHQGMSEDLFNREKIRYEQSDYVIIDKEDYRYSKLFDDMPNFELVYNLDNYEVWKQNTLLNQIRIN